MSPTTEEEHLVEAISTLEPGELQVRRMEAAVFSALRERPRSLTAEWMDLFRINPVMHGSYALAASAALLIFSPLGFLRALWPQ